MELLRAHVASFNHGVRTGRWGPMLARFDEHAVMGPWDFIALVQYPDNEAAFRALAKIGLLEVVKTETFPIEKVEVFFKTLV